MAQRGRLELSVVCPVAGLNRKSPAKAQTVADDPGRVETFFVPQ